LATTGGTHNDLPRAQNALIGTRWKIVGGYRGNNETRIAMERGEVQAAVSPATLFNAQIKPWLVEGKVRLVVQYADFRHPALPNVPTIVDLADNEEAKGVFRFLVSVSTLGRAYIAPPGVPVETVAILRKAIQTMFNDPAVKADADKRGADLLPMSGEDMSVYIKQILSTPRSIVEKTNEVVRQR
jgi:tripartite-type tricarboxylate transporter receptor subunit TctC